MAATCLVLLTAGLVTARAFPGPLPAADAAQLAQGAGKPNIVVVMADDMRFDDLQFAPTLRRLASHGVKFHNSFSPFPLCCPARASFLTGQLAHNHGVFWHERPYGYGAFDDSRTLSTSLRRAGYRTGFVGKYLNRYGLDRSKVTGRPSHRYVPRGWTDWFATFQTTGRQPGVRGDAYNYMSTPFNVNGRVRNHVDRYQTNVVGSYSRRLIERYHRRRDPFFVYVNYLAPHFGGPREPDDPRDVRDRRGRRDVVRTPARPDSVRNRFDGLINRARGLPRGGGPAEADVSDKPGFIGRLPEPSRSERRAGRALTRQRAQAIYVMDEQIRRTIRTLKRTGEWSNTYVVFTSDNGYYLGEHRIVQGKVRGHEPSLRVPMIIAGPGARDGTGRYDPITTVDLTRTILDLGRAAPPMAPDGTSLLPTLRGGDQGWDRAVPIESALGTPAPRETVFQDDDVLRSSGVRTTRYTYIRYSNGQTELYDLYTDPHQDVSAHQDPELTQIRELLRQAWDQMYRCRGAQCQAPLPEALRAAPAENRAGTRAWLAAHERRYGYR
ncbi:MAG: sulfatase-like hydrolase/transferase [Nocardioides sp.]